MSKKLGHEPERSMWLHCTECNDMQTYWTEWSDAAEADPAMKRLVVAYPDPPDGTVCIRCYLCNPGLPKYVYVASSWRCDAQPAVIAVLRSAGIQHYDFRNPPDGSGFGWEQIPGQEAYVRSNRFVHAETYLKMIGHPIADAGYSADFAAMQQADTFVLVLPCGKSAHLELGWAVGAGKRTAILLEDPMEPELMYKMVDYIAPTMMDLLSWLGVED